MVFPRPRFSAITPALGIPSGFWASAPLIGLSLAWLAACAPGAPDPAPSPDRAGPSSGTLSGPSLGAQIIYVIHGDAGYAYHDSAGERRFADMEALAQGESVARAAPAAEVFIFHQKPAPFPRFLRKRDGLMRQYRYGRLLRTEPYARARGEGDLAAESRLFRKYTAFPVQGACPMPDGGMTEKAPAPPDSMPGLSPDPARIFLYFGHEIPVTDRIPRYSRSRPDLDFSLAAFARGLERFGGPACAQAKPFSLIALSACHGGTPAATMALAPYALFLLASPGELHLSYLDTRPLAGLVGRDATPTETGWYHPEDGPRSRKSRAETWGKTVADTSFARLRERTSTSITLSLYDTEKASAYLAAHEDAWPSAAEAPTPQSGPTHRDCAQNPGFGPGGRDGGVTVYYQAPRFGLDKSKAFRSGWQCPM